MAAGRRAPRILLAALAALVAVLLARNATGPASWPGWTTYLYSAIEIGAVAVCAWRAVAVPAERAAWAGMTLGMALFAAGDVLWMVDFTGLPPDAIPYPSPADALYLAFYPCVYVAIGLLLRARAGGVTPSQWLDGLTSALGVAAISAALLIGVIQAGTGGAALTVATNLAYPIGDSCSCCCSARSWGRSAAGRRDVVDPRRGPGDLRLRRRAPTSCRPPTARTSRTRVLDVVWPLSLVLFAAAAWQPRHPHRRRRLDGWRTLAVPAFAGLCALAVVLYDHYHRVTAASMWLAAAALLALMLRLTLLMAAHRRMLASAERDARTDSLTGLPNRRRARRRAAVAGGPPVAGGPRALRPRRVQGLQRHASAIPPATRCCSASRGSSPSRPGSRPRVPHRRRRVLRRHRAGEIAPRRVAAPPRRSASAARTADHRSSGSVSLPDEAQTPPTRCASSTSGCTRASAAAARRPSRQARDVLLRAVVRARARTSASTAATSPVSPGGRAPRSGCRPRRSSRSAHAAELHDVGKVAIPDAILDKPGPLDDDGVGVHAPPHDRSASGSSRAAPALAPVAPLVRSSHERWDGGGYPDGLAGEEIPLGARIVAVCDACDAMVSDRAYRAAATPADALAELRRCAGTQFDPAVVAAFAEVLEDASLESCPVRRLAA